MSVDAALGLLFSFHSVALFLCVVFAAIGRLNLRVPPGSAFPSLTFELSPFLRLELNFRMLDFDFQTLEFHFRTLEFNFRALEFNMGTGIQFSDVVI